MGFWQTGLRSIVSPSRRGLPVAARCRRLALEPLEIRELLAVGAPPSGDSGQAWDALPDALVAAETVPTGARVVATAPALDTPRVMPFDTLDVSFDRPIDSATFRADAVRLFADREGGELLWSVHGSFNDCKVVGTIASATNSTAVRTTTPSATVNPAGSNWWATGTATAGWA